MLIAELTGCWVHPTEKCWIDVRKAQADAAARPEFKGSVLFVETHEFVRDEKVSPGGWACHEWNNAETYFLVGNAMGEGMKKLLSTPAQPIHGGRPTGARFPGRKLVARAH
jgi:hypothetical protein